MRQVMIVLILLIPVTVCADTLQGRVVKVTDGDTITIIDDQGDKNRIRLAGIDAPERDQPYGKESTESLFRLVSDKIVTIEYSKRDKYKRIIGKVLVDPPGDIFCLAIDCVKKINSGLEQIKAGLAWHYKKYKKEQSEGDRKLYSEAEIEAQNNGFGLWKDEKPMPPWKWRRSR